MSTRTLLCVVALAAAWPVCAAEGDVDERFVLTISGGISLGAYDSGRNWIVLRDLHQRRAASGTRPMRQELLGAITGASAGAINAFISAMDWCTASGVPGGNSVGSNPYRTMWTSITFEKLLPPAPSGLGVDNSKYADDRETNRHRDGVLARTNADEEVMELLRTWYEGDGVSFVPRCRVPLGFTVTRSEPRQEPLFDGLKFTFPQQTYYVALVFEIGLDGRPHLYHDESVYDDKGFEPNRTITFADKSHRFDGKLLRLPACAGRSRQNAICHDAHSPSPASEISFEQLVGVLYASSAVPVAFGRVFMDYCDENPAEHQSRGCPGGQTIENDDFIDGGVFDNVPIGFGLALANSNPPNPSLRFFYIDSDVLDDNLAPAGIANDRASREYRIPNQLAFLGGTVQTARAAGRVRPITDLCRGTTDNCADRAIIAKRSGRITGEMLGAFGAFIDERFAQYDYALGVADGLRTIAVNGETPLDAAHRLKIVENNDEWRRIAWLVALDPEPDPAAAGEFAAIHAALAVADADFAAFAAELGKAKFKVEGNALLRRALDGAPDWYMLMFARVTDRLRYLEFHHTAEEPGAMGAAIAVVDNYTKLNTQVPGWSLSGTVNESWRWLPPQVGLETFHGSIEIAWRPTWSGQRLQFEFPFGLQHDLAGDSLSDVQGHLGLNVRFPPVAKKLLRFGLGPRLYYDFDPRGRPGRRHYYGGAAFVDIVSALRLEAAYRDSPWDDYWFVTVSAYDLPSVLRLIFRN
ncbi:MAG: hypothetical protein WD081_06600 [Gammaproteobacteria bacterium]